MFLTTEAVVDKSGSAMPFKFYYEKVNEGSFYHYRLFKDN